MRRTCARDSMAGAIQVYMAPPKAMDKSVRDARKTIFRGEHMTYNVSIWHYQNNVIYYVLNQILFRYLLTYSISFILSAFGKMPYLNFLIFNIQVLVATTEKKDSVTEAECRQCLGVVHQTMQDMLKTFNKMMNKGNKINSKVVWW